MSVKKHPYQQIDFWDKNRFWKNGNYTAKSVKELDLWATDIVKEKSFKHLNKDFKNK